MIYDVMQYTGLKDKNATEIYEGDIILAGHYKWKCKVIWDKKCARFIGITNDKDVKIVYVDMVDKNGISAVEVVGNIYENPELIHKNCAGVQSCFSVSRMFRETGRRHDNSEG